jgi:hypothetical protein
MSSKFKRGDLVEGKCGSGGVIAEVFETTNGTFMYKLYINNLLYYESDLSLVSGSTLAPENPKEEPETTADFMMKYL